MSEHDSRHGGPDPRLIELEMDWSRPTRPTPPLAETQAESRRRLDGARAEAQRVFAAIEGLREEAIGLLQEMVRIPSVNPSPGYERVMAAFFAAQMERLGLQVRTVEPEPDRVNVMGTWQGTGMGPDPGRDQGPGRDPVKPPVLALHGHMDTVPPGEEQAWSVPPFGGVVREGKLFGRGAKDSKLGLAAQLMTVRALQAAGVRLRGTLKLSGEADEEMGGHLGSNEIVKAGHFADVDWVIYTEGLPERISLGHRGILWVELTAHAVYAEPKTAAGAKVPQTWKSMKHRTSNPILQMGELARLVDTMAFTPVPPDPIIPGESAYASVNRIWGGEKENAMPAQCSILADIRMLPGLSAAQILADVNGVLDRYRREHAHLGGIAVAEPQVRMAARPSSTHPHEPIVTFLQDAIREVMGIEARPQGSSGGGGGSRWITLDAGVPLAQWAAGRNTSHRPDEYIVIDDYIHTIKVYALLSLMLLS